MCLHCSQGNYIRHPVLFELSHKYGVHPAAGGPAGVGGPAGETGGEGWWVAHKQLEELKEAIRREIRKELKIKEGAEKLREVAKDRRSQADVAALVKISNSRLAELQAELHELESQIILTQGRAGTEPPSTPVTSTPNGLGGGLTPLYLLAGHRARVP
ncbi:hypothetical protein B566_EDAN000953 [Ephemera danica]|nr:hypothetical protein B566_EDAN000953 [Ephemera danica]